MTNYDLILAAALICAPPDTPEHPPTPDRWPAMQQALHATAIRMEEILDEREVRYVVTRVEDFQTDLDLLRRRHRDLKDAPPLADADRLPPRENVQSLIQFNRAYREHLLTRQAWEADRRDIIAVALGENDRLYLVWDAVRDARCDFYYVTVRRQALQRLRMAVGEEAYATVDLPPHVPVWRFIQH